MNVFAYDSGFSRLVRKVWSCLTLNALWLLCCLPVVTAGAGTAALLWATEMHVVREEGHAWQSFWHAFRADFKQATVIWLLTLLAAGVLFLDLQYFLVMVTQENALGTLWVVIAVLLVAVVLTASFALAYLSRFQDTTGKILKNAFLLALSHPLVGLKLIVLVLINVLCAAYYPIFLLIMPMISAWLMDLSMNKIFRRLDPDSVMDEDEDELVEE